MKNVWGVIVCVRHFRDIDQLPPQATDSGAVSGWWALRLAVGLAGNFILTAVGCTVRDGVCGGGGMGEWV
jgi:hypothetical protein